MQQQSLDILLCIYKDVLRLLGETLKVGEKIVGHVDELYQKKEGQSGPGA